MTNWNGFMHYHFITELMRNTADKLLGVEINARFASDTVHPLHPDFVISVWDSEQERDFMLEQIRLIAEKRDWFEHNSLICILNLIDGIALLATGDPAIKSTLHTLPPIAPELSECFLSNTMCLNNLLISSFRDGPNALRLGDFGSGSVGTSPLVCGYFGVVKLDRGFFLEQVEKSMFPVLIKNIKEYCDHAVMKGVGTVRPINEASTVGVRTMQDGTLYPLATFTEVDTLLLPTLYH